MHCLCMLCLLCLGTSALYFGFVHEFLWRINEGVKEPFPEAGPDQEAPSRGLLGPPPPSRSRAGSAALPPPLYGSLCSERGGGP